jgi:hypothetical protein
MNKDLHLVQLASQLELLKRHLAEWKILLLEQKQARHLARELANHYPIHHSVERTDILRRTAQKADTLALLAMTHLNEQQRLRARHQQEETELETRLKSQQSG